DARCRACTDRGRRRRCPSQRPHRRRDRLRDRGHPPVRDRDRTAGPLRRHVPSRRAEPDDCRGAPLQHQRIRHLLRREDGPLDLRLLLGCMTSIATEARRPVWQVTAVRLRLGLVGLLVALAIAAWWWTAREMRGMDGGPWTSLGGLGWFVGVW